MNEILKFALYLLTMAGVTYLLRLLPLIFVNKKIESPFILRFLYYIPYTVLAAMTVPAILYSTSYMSSAIFGAAVALLLAYMNRGLFTVSFGAALAVFVAEWIIPYIPLNII